MFKVARRRVYRAVSFLTVFSVVAVGTYYVWEPTSVEATTETFSAAGAGSWVAPAGVTSVEIQCWGAGGGGGSGGANNSSAAGGGGAGAYAIVTSFSVTPGNSYDYVVGSGGTGGSGTTDNATAGTDSTFATTTCVADAGQPGLINGTAGAAGTAGNSTGDTTFSGGAGGAGEGANDGTGGGGGGSAGSGSAGTTGTAGASGGGGGAGGTGTDPGAAGGAGGPGGGAGVNGNAPGAGGGGGGERSGGSAGEEGGDGAAGQIILNYNADTTPPSPNPPYFVTVPAPDSSSQITMISTTTTDTSSPVQYFFTETVGDCGGDHDAVNGSNSDWQTSPTYSDTGLLPNKCYAYTITSRDNGQVTGATSTASSTYTFANVPGAPTYSSVGVTTLTISNTENSNPSSNPTTQFYVRASSTDAGWNNYFIATTTATSATPVWLTDLELDSTALTGLTEGTRYDFESVARNADNIVTATSTLSGTSTLADTFAPTPAASFAVNPDDVSNSVIDMTAATSTDDTPPVEYRFVFTACSSNGGAGADTSTWSQTQTYTDTGLDTNRCYGYSAETRDSVSPTPNTSSSAVVEAYTTANTPGAPTVDFVTGSTTSITINPNGNPINTEFLVRFSGSSPNDTDWEGRFVNTDGTPTTTQIWMSTSTINALTISNLKDLTSYDIDVQARNGDNDTTSFGPSTSTTTLDQTPPQPDPATFATAPTSTSNSVINMVATTATDAGGGGVEYYFATTTGTCGGDLGAGSTDSGWQSGGGAETYNDTGLETNRCYAYTVQYRDTATTSNVGQASAAFSVYTNANTPAAPTLSSVTASTFDITVNANGNPSNTEFAVRASSTDIGWDGFYLDTDGSSSTVVVWMTKSVIDAITFQGLQNYTTYDVEVRARSGDMEETSFGPSTSTTTLDTIAPTPNPATFDTPPNNTGVSSINMVATTATDAGVGGVQYQFSYNVGSCGASAGTDGTSSVWQGGSTYNDTGLQTNKCYGYTVQYRDASLNTGTISGVSQTYTSAAVPGQPSGTSITDYTFQVVNDANGNPTADPVTEFTVYFTSSDANWNQRYLNSDGTATTSPVWMSDSTIEGITVTGLLPSTTYTAGVLARNFDGDVTATSTTGDITTAADATAPTPNPTAFSSIPVNDSSTQISMTAGAVTDDTTPVEYYFSSVQGSCTAADYPGASNSDWQTSTTFNATGLSANQCYGYTITARDAAGNANATSTASSTYTSAIVPGAVTLQNAADVSITINNTENGNPTANPATTFAVQISATSDSNWLNQYVDASGASSSGEVWLTDAQIDGLTVTGMQPSTSYTFRVKARNADGDETAFGSTQAFITRDEIFQKIRLEGGVRLQGTRLY